MDELGITRKFRAQPISFDFCIDEPVAVPYVARCPKQLTGLAATPRGRRKETPPDPGSHPAPPDVTTECRRLRSSTLRKPEPGSDSNGALRSGIEFGERSGRRMGWEIRRVRSVIIPYRDSTRARSARISEARNGPGSPGTGLAFTAVSAAVKPIRVRLVGRVRLAGHRPAPEGHGWRRFAGPAVAQIAPAEAQAYGRLLGTFDLGRPEQPEDNAPITGRSPPATEAQPHPATERPHRSSGLPLSCRPRPLFSLPPDRIRVGGRSASF